MRAARRAEEEAVELRAKYARLGGEMETALPEMRSDLREVDSCCRLVVPLGADAPALPVAQEQMEAMDSECAQQ